MKKAIICPNEKSREFIELLKEQPDAVNAYRDAYKVYEANGGQYPDHIINKINNSTELKPHSVNEDKKILKKQITIDKAKHIITLKLNKLVKVGVKEEFINNYTRLLTDLTNYESDAAIIEFVKAADRIMNGAVKTIEEIEKNIENNDKDEDFILTGLDRIKDYTGVFDLLDDILSDANNDQNIRDHKDLIVEIIGKKNYVLKKTNFLIKSNLTKRLSKENNVIEAKYKLQAEREFAKTDNAKKLKGKEKQQAKRDFINNYMADNKNIILFETMDHTNNMLTFVEDIPYLVSQFTAPADINNNIMAYAVEISQLATWKITERVNKQAETFSELYDRYSKFVGKKSNMEELYEPLLEKDIEGNLTGNYVNPNTSIKQYTELKKGKYKGTVVEELYDEIIKLQEEKDKKVPMGFRLGYRLPSVNKSLIERVYSENILATTGKTIKDRFTLTQSDTETGEINDNLEGQKKNTFKEVITNEKGQENQGVPVHYRSKTDLKTQSYDVLGISMLDIHNTTNFKEKSLVGIVLHSLRETVAESKVVKRDVQGILKINKITKQVATIDGVDSNLYKNLTNFINLTVNGVSVEGNPQTLKIVNTFKNATSTSMMALNYLSAGANMTQGTVMAWIEAAGGETGSFGVKNKNRAYVKYTKDLHNILNDISKNIPESKTGLLARKLHIDKLYSAKDKKFIEDNIAKKIGVSGALRFMDSIGETNQQVLLMYSVLDNIKVLDKDGNFLDKDFNPTKDREKAISFDDAHELVDGKLVLNKKVFKTERTNGISDEDMLKLSRYIGSISKKLFGNYNPENKSIAQRTLLGHLLFQMRGWLVPGIERRYKGIGKVNTRSEDLDLAQMNYNKETEQFEEGTYTSAVRFIFSVSKDIKKLKVQAIPENWNKLTDYEKSNINKSLVGLGITVGVLAIFLSLKEGLEDDEDKDFATLLTAYYARRLFSELVTYTNPNEGLRTFKQPAVIIGPIQDIVKLITQSIDPMEEYETGYNKGKNKWLYKAGKILGTNKIFNDQEERLQTNLVLFERNE